MMIPLSPLRACVVRVRGYLAIALATIASIATSSAPEQRSLNLQDVIVELPAEAPEARTQFRVESSTGKYFVSIDSTFETNVSPEIEIRVLEPTTAQQLRLESDLISQTHARLYARVEFTCEFPCTVDFEVVVRAGTVLASSARGSLSIGVEFDDVFHDDVYLAIEPLP
jgi:hypothetical protein